MSKLGCLLGACIVVSVMAPLAVAVQAQEIAGSGFKRDRNLSVTERIPAEYRAMGMKVGGFTAFPKVTAGLESTSNVYYAATGEESDLILGLAPELALKSNWSRHSLSALAKVNTRSYADFDSDNTNTWTISAAGRLDVVGTSHAFGALAIDKSAELRSEEPDLRSARSPIEFDASSGHIGYAAEGNRLRMVVRTDFQTFDYDDVSAIAGGMIDQDYRDRTETRYSVRGEYAISPDTSVFAVYEANDRDYDIATLGRSSNGSDFAVGVSFDLTRLVRGEVQFGVLSQEYDNPSYDKGSGASYRAKVDWFPTELTTVHLTASRAIRETPAVNASGYEATAYGFVVDHELRRNIILSGGISLADNAYNGIARDDDRATVQASATYRMSDNISVTGGYTYSKLDSSGVDRVDGYDSHSLRAAVSFAY